MQQELEDFYKENKRFPSTQEKNEMLEKIGCVMEGNDCVYERERIILDEHETNTVYTIDFEIENSYCVLFRYKKTNRNTVVCNNKACISLKQ